MTNQATLRRIDDEVTQRRQQIAALQVEIARLEDTRRVLMGLAEADHMAAQARREGPPPGLMNGSHAKPVLIVRKTGTGDEDGTESKRRKMGENGAAKNGTYYPGTRRKKRDASARATWRQRVKALLDEPDTEPMTAGEIGNYFGLPIGKGRKDLQNALYYLRMSKDVEKDGEGRYSRPTRQ